MLTIDDAFTRLHGRFIVIFLITGHVKIKTMFESFESCYIYIRTWSIDDELRGLTAWGMNLLCGLVAVDTSVSFARRHEGKQTVACVG